MTAVVRQWAASSSGARRSIAGHWSGRERLHGHRPDGAERIRPLDVVRNVLVLGLHPFGGAGLGIYFLQDKFWDGEITRETKLGGTLFGGIELYAKPRTASFKIEARYHAVRNTVGNPDGLAISLGFKNYF